jgi:BirA family biotin operon repressor/biotin-[acetyl-CoA-carboxylase] ligase
MIEDKKVSGIVVDISIDDKTINYAVIGVGINANIDAAKLSSYVNSSRGGINSKYLGITSLKNELSGKNVNIIVIMQSLLEKLEYYYFQLEKEGSKKIITKLKERSETVGNSVLVKQDKETFEGVAIDIDADGILLVKTPEGNINEVASGEIIVIRK